MRRYPFVLTLLGALGGATPAWAQPPLLTLPEALQRADAHAYANRTASANASAQSAQAIAPLRGILPSLRVEAGYVRTTDPIGAFGTTLRQRTITQADFDPRRLNYPGVASNYAGGVVLEQPLFNADAHLGRLAAGRAAAAGRASEQWTKRSTRVDVVRAYYGATLAAEKVATLEVAARAAHEHVRQAEAMVRNGLVTRSDALLAAVKAGEVDAQLIEARGQAALAKKQLALLLGQPGDTAFALPAALPAADTAALRREAATPAPDNVAVRADVRAAQLGLAAAQADMRRAQSLYLPRLNAFARYDWNSADQVFAGDRNWTAGLMLSWTPFAGASEIAEWRGGRARAAAAQALAEGAEAQARLQVEQAATELQVALERLTIAERAVGQSREAHRIVTRRYQGELAGVTELLDAAAAETAAELGRSHALYTALTAAAALRHAQGAELNGEW